MMELAAHIRNVEQENDLDELQEHLITFYDGAAIDVKEYAKELDHSIDRIYIGDEFCWNRLPLRRELNALLSLADEKKKAVTLLTPTLTDSELERATLLFDCLKERHPRAEVVVNDWGVLFFLRENYPGFRLAAGRLLNKGFKDPRLRNAADLASLSRETEELLNTSTFDGVEFQEKMIELGIGRLERDILPYGQRPPPNNSRLQTTIHFPLGYVTTGRVCWVATFDKPNGGKFVPMNGCSRLCNAMTLELKNSNFSLPIIQSGNTVYYLYSPSMLASILREGWLGKFRLVYEGFAV